MTQDHIIGCILGTAVGDALGLPYEGLSRCRAARMLGPPDRYRFLFRRGMVSDDTEHTCIVAQSMISSGGDINAFRRALAWRFRWWLLGLPAGIGRATLRAILRLWIGISPERSGVFSAGNGPAMRAAVLGASVREISTLVQLVQTSSRMTHGDPKAEYGALAVALAAYTACESEHVSADAYYDQLQVLLGHGAEEFLSLIAGAVKAAKNDWTTEQFADSLGLSRGVSGYTYHTVPVAIHAWFAHPRDFRSAVTSVIRCGGETDTTAAIVGGIVGAAVGRNGIPSEWLDRLLEWPRTVAWMERLGRQLHDAIQSGGRARPPRLSAPGLLARNVLFLIVVLCHGFRRLGPPY